MIFCTDIDNTLIYSHRRGLPEPRIIAEMLNGKEQAYISAELYDIMKSICGDVTVIPVTMRTPAQYGRITVLGGICRYAVVCGGAVLLDNGVPDEEWNAGSLAAAGNELDSVKAVRDLMEGFTGGKGFHEFAPFMAYAKTEEPDKLKKYLISRNIGGVDIFSDMRKVYCTAASLTKGKAADRLCERFSADRIIAAGDGEQDISMLCRADTAIIPECLAGTVKCADTVISQGRFLSDDIIYYFRERSR